MSFQKISLRVVRENCTEYDAALITSPDAATKILHDILIDETQEVFLVACLNPKKQVVAYSEIGRGNLTGCPVHPRDVFKVAFASNADSIIIAHNHPSGDSTPSTQDLRTTEALVDAGWLLGIQVLDHIIVADTDTALRDTHADLFNKRY